MIRKISQIQTSFLQMFSCFAYLEKRQLAELKKMILRFFPHQFFA